jgi:hypothetical protein
MRIFVKHELWSQRLQSLELEISKSGPTGMLRKDFDSTTGLSQPFVMFCV